MQPRRTTIRTPLRNWLAHVWYLSIFHDTKLYLHASLTIVLILTSLISAGTVSLYSVLLSQHRSRYQSHELQESVRYRDTKKTIAASRHGLSSSERMASTMPLIKGIMYTCFLLSKPSASVVSTAAMALFLGGTLKVSPIAATCILAAFALANVGHRSIPTLVQEPSSNVIFQHGKISYLANTEHPLTSFKLDRYSTFKRPTVGEGTLITVLRTNESAITRQLLRDLVFDYTARDDVFSEYFLEGVYISSNAPQASLESGAMDYLTGLGVKHVMVEAGISLPPLWTSAVHIQALDLPPGPYFASCNGDSVSLSLVHRLYEDTYDDFLYGTYATEDEASGFAAVNAAFDHPAIPVPSRLYSIVDPRPFAGYRVAVKDLFDMRGLITSEALEHGRTLPLPQTRPPQASSASSTSAASLSANTS